MTTDTNMLKVQVGNATFKVQPEHRNEFLKQHPGAVVLNDQASPAEEEPVELDDMKVAQLRELAAELGVEVPSKIKRDELLALVKAETERQAQSDQPENTGSDDAGSKGDHQPPAGDDGSQE